MKCLDDYEGFDPCSKKSGIFTIGVTVNDQRMEAIITKRIY